MNNPETPIEPKWVELEPLIDDAIASLPDAQRLAIVQHYLQQKSQVEIAAEEEVDQSTISRRLNQGVEALRLQLKNAGVVLSVAALTTFLLAGTSRAAPPAVAACLTKVGLAGVGKTSMGWSVTHVVVACLVLVGVAVPTIVAVNGGTTASPSAASSQSITQPVADYVSLVDVEGRPVRQVRIATSIDDIYNGLLPDADGHMPLNRFARSPERYFGYSQSRGKMVVFSVPETMTGTVPPVILNMNCAQADGCVVDPNGAPVAGVRVRLFLSLAGEASFLFETSGETDNSGYFSCGTIPSYPGVTVRASLSDNPTDAESTPPINTNGLLQIEFPSLIDRFDTPAPKPGPREFGIRAESWTNPTPLEGAIVSMSFPSQHMTYKAGNVITDASGRFSRVLPPGAQDVSFRLLHPDYIGFHFGRDNISPDAAALTDGSAVLVMKKGLAATGIVLDAAGKPVINALVMAGRLYGSTPGPDSETIEDCMTARTDAAGRYRIGGLPAGKNRLSVNDDQFAPAVIAFDLGKGTSPVSIVLDTGGTFSGTTDDAAGKPLAGVRIGCQDWRNGELQPEPPSRSAVTDASGRFTLAHLPRQGELSFYGSLKGFLGTNFKWSAEAKPASDVTVTLYKPPVVAGVVRDANTDLPITRFDVVPGIF